MFARSRLLLGVAALSAGFLSACADSTNPTSPTSPRTPLFSGRTVDSTGVQLGGGGGGGGGTGGGGTGGGGTYQSCGVLSANVQTYNIVVYTTRIGIGFSGTATNCGTKNEAFEVDVVDVNTDPVCHVDVPHFIAQKNSAPGETVYWSANSTLVNCMNTTHTFVLTLYDTKTGQALGSTTVSAFL